MAHTPRPTRTAPKTSTAALPRHRLRLDLPCPAWWAAPIGTSSDGSLPRPVRARQFCRPAAVPCGTCHEMSPVGCRWRALAAGIVGMASTGHTAGPVTAPSPTSSCSTDTGSMSMPQPRLHRHDQECQIGCVGATRAGRQTPARRLTDSARQPRARIEPSTTGAVGGRRVRSVGRPRAASTPRRGGERCSPAARGGPGRRPAGGPPGVT